jgi:GntR family transcriptional regulator
VNARRPGDDPPGYRDVAAELREQIMSGALPDGAVVPGENTLRAAYGISRTTARDALRVLKDEGLTVTRQGSRTRVRLFKPLRRLGNKRLSREHWGAGRAIWEVDAKDRNWVPDQVDVSEAAAPAHIAAALGLEPGTRVVIRARRFTVDGRPVQLATSYLPASIAAGTQIAEVNTGPGGSYARLTDLGFAPAEFAEEIRARMPSPEEIGRLELPPGTPVIALTRRAATAEGVTVEVNEMVLDAYAYVLEYSFSA